MSRREPDTSPFCDLSNLRTPRPNPKTVPPSPQFFTASKSALQAPTPTSLRRRRPGDGVPTPTPLGRRLHALEVDQSRSARRAESGRERALRTFSASASSWLSLLLRDPSACGCFPGFTGSAAAAQPWATGKRGALDGDRARGGRSPKRCRGGGDRGGERSKEMTPAMVAALRESLKDACSLEDVTERMEKHMSKGACEEVLFMMFQICKNIDEGRLKMKARCPLVTDLRLKEKATRVFMSYNPYWLRIGLHIVLGGDSLLQTGQGKRDKEVHFLKLILEKHMLSQIMTAKSCGNKKLVEEHHVQGYSDVLGNIILKRIFLLVVALDRTKIESTLPLEAGIDGLDGGSPLLFCHQSQIKSSRQIIQESLRETMHGEGDILVHLTTMGYKLNYQQPALSEYDFTMRNLFEDLQDGIILCRVVQLLLADASIISKVIVPSDTDKKRRSNCTTAIQYIKQARVPLSDSDGVTISAEDIAAGDKELILSLLWNMFIHMQLPLLASATSLARELTKLNVHVTEQQISENKPHMGLLYNWVQAICSKIGMTVESSSQLDRRALNCFINYYLNIDISPFKETPTGCRKELFTCHQLDTISDIAGWPSSEMGKVLSDVLQAVDIPASGILADGVLFDERSTILLLAFLSSHLTNDERLDQLKNLINMRLYKSADTKIAARRISRGKIDIKYHPSQTDKNDGACTNQEWAATIIQTQARSLIAKNKYCERKKAIFILQGALRAWSAIISNRNRSCLSIAASIPWQAQGNNRYFIFIMERHRFVQMRKSAIMIQLAVRIWIRGRKKFKNSDSFKSCEFLEGKTPPKISSIAPSPQEHCSGGDKTIASPTACKHCEHVLTVRASAAAPILYFDGMDSLDSTTPLQFSGNQSNFITSTTQLCKSEHDCRSCVVEKSNSVSVSKLVSADDIQCSSSICFPVCKELVAAQTIQSAYRRFLNNRNRITGAIKIQSHWRCYSVRKCFMKEIQAIVGIQTSIRVFLCYQAFQRHRLAAVLIQRVVRGWLARKRLLGSSSLRTYTRLCVVDQSQKRKCYQSLELNIVLDSVIRLQRCWRKFLLRQSVKTYVISIQSFVRGWLARKQLNQTFRCINIIQRWWRKVLQTRKRAVIVIQTRFRGWVARQDAIRTRNSICNIQRWWRKVLFLKLRKQAALVIQAHFRGWIARQVAFRTRKSITIIQKKQLQLSTATEYSKKCCEKLVAAGAVDILLKQIYLLNRGIADQEVLKQVFLTLRNIARYSNLRQVLASTAESVEIIFQELLRNKADGFFIASDILKSLCESKEGRETVQALSHLIKRLRNLVHDLEKKVELDKRNGRTGAVKATNLRRLREAATLYHILTSGT
ncbi:binding [Zea mays]|uniref:Binding n=1 Tax=Zea mays TaxID=4577 RepID=A0A1D6ID71_MAIZE|nr:binding [Zea mays]